LPRLLAQATPKECLCEQAAASASADDLITPGRFEFDLSRCPSVLIFSMEGKANSQGEHVGAFLAGLMQNDCPNKAGLPSADSVETRTQQLAVT
jgi:hypothetical protein